jgi:hypothetical protein
MNFEDLLKFIYSEKAIQFCEIFTLLLTTVTSVPKKKGYRVQYCITTTLGILFSEQTLHRVTSKVKILQNCVAFSEYMNLFLRKIQNVTRKDLT